MQKQKPLSARILSLVLTVAMVTTMLPATVFATEGDGNLSLGASSIKAFDKLEDRFIPSATDASVYSLGVPLDTPYEDLKLPTELTVTVERTSTVSTPVEDEVKDSGDVITDDSIPSEEDNTDATPVEDEVKAFSTDATLNTEESDDTTVSGNQPATPSDAEKDTADENTNKIETPAPKDEPEQAETTVTTTTQESIPVTWKGDKEYTADKNSRVIYTAEISADYSLADGVKLPQIYVFVGKQARAGTSTTITATLDFTLPFDEGGMSDKTSCVDGNGHTEHADAPCWTWVQDPDSSEYTLTLSGVDIDVDGVDPDAVNAGINLPSDAATTIVLAAGTINKVKTNGVNDWYDFGIYAYAPLKITGTGTLEVAAEIGGIFTDGNIEIESGTVSATSEMGSAINANYGDVIIASGTVNATTKAQGYYATGAIRSDANVTISGGTVTATSIGEVEEFSYGAPAIDVSNNGLLTISGDDTVVTATSKNGEAVAITPQSYQVIMRNAKKVTLNGARGTMMNPPKVLGMAITSGNHHFNTENENVVWESSTIISYPLNFTLSAEEDGVSDSTNCVDGNGHTEHASAPCWTWNSTDSILTLSNIKMHIEDDPAIVLPETATVTLADGTTNKIEYCSWMSVIDSMNVTINGGGTLDVFLMSDDYSALFQGETLSISGNANVNAESVVDTISVWSGAFTASENAKVTLTSTSGNAINSNNGSINISDNAVVTATGGECGLTAQDITITGGTTTAKGGTAAIQSTNPITVTGLTVKGDDKTKNDPIGAFVSGTTKKLVQAAAEKPVIIGVFTDPAITLGEQSAPVTYGTVASPTFTVSAENFDDTNPAFAPSIEWVTTSHDGVDAKMSDDNTKVLVTTTATAKAGDYKFKVVSSTADSDNYESAEATLKIDPLEASITWGTTTSFPWTGSAQAPTATVSNKVGSDEVTVTVTGAETNVGANYTATASALAGAAKDNYKLPTTGLTQAFSITKATYTGTQAAAPTLASRDDSSVTLTVQAVTGETVEYGYSSTADGAITWQDNATFGSLAVNTEYFFFARVKANTNHNEGTTSASTKISTTKSNYSGTAAASPSMDSKTDTTVVLTAVTVDGEAVQYAKSITNVAPADNAAWQDSTTFSSLSPNTQYFFFARVKENDIHAAGGVSAGTTITTDKSAYTTKADAPNNTPASKTDTSITLAPVTPPSGEALEYGYSTDGTEPTTWQDSTTFSGLTSNKEYTFFARVKENTTHKAGPASTGTKIKTDKSDADKLADAKAAVTAALNGFTATNATDADAIIALANKAISDAGIIGVTTSWDTSGAFNKTNADEDNTGSVTGTLKLTCNAASDTVALNKTIAKLPGDPAAKIALVKAAIETALNAFNPTNATTADDVKAIVDKANTDSGVTGVTVAWKAPSDFKNTNSTNSADGSVTGTFDLSCTTSGGSATGTVAVNRPILRTDEQKLADAKAKAEAALAAFIPTNATTADDILAVVNKALTDAGLTGITPSWKSGSGFNKTNATQNTAGGITGTITLTLNAKTADVTVDLTIASFGNQLKDAIAAANTAKTGISVNDSPASSVANGTKFVNTAEMKALTDAIAAAEVVANNSSATEAEITAAVTALNNAVSTFKAAIKTGTYTSSGGSTGGGPSNDDNNNNNNTPIVVPPDPTKPNLPTTVETKVPAAVDNKGNANVTVTDKTIQDAIDKAVAEAKKNGTSGNGISVIISVTTGGKDANTVTVNLPKTVQEKVIAGKVVNTVVVVDRPDIAINMNLSSITEINKQAKSDVQLSATRMDNTKLSADAKTAIGNRPTFDLKATYASGTKAVSDFGTGSVTVEIPYTLQAGELAGGLYAVYVDGNGKVSYLTNSSYDAKAKVLRFSTNHFSVYGIGYKAPTGFTDITNHWAKDDIEFVVNRGLFSGTSNTTFAPNGAMTRGMFVTALGRLAGVDTKKYENTKFTDVKADAYYAPYVAWATVNSIVKGTSDTTFAPDQSITREQMAVIIEGYAKAIGYTLPNAHAENTFADNAKIGTWAKDSVKKVQMAGIISGKNGNVFDPQGTATRAEVSAVLRRFMELVISTDTAQGWMMNDSGSWMYYENGKAVTGTKTIAGKTYAFNANGEMTEGYANPETGGPMDTTAYTVVKNDNWWKIASKFKVNIYTLAKLNGKTIFSILYPGDVLKIPQQS